jgi:hypothetical protein
VKNNKIKLWKVGDRKLSEKYAIYELMKQRPEYSYSEFTWSVKNSEEHNEVFDLHAPKWFRQWEIHEGYKGFDPHKRDSLAEGDQND